jgi:hypothetical protein
VAMCCWGPILLLFLFSLSLPLFSSLAR